MRFARLPLAEAEGAINVHALRVPGAELRKGARIDAAALAALAQAGIAEIVAVRLEPGDVSEDDAAAEIAAAVSGDYATVDAAFTGRANIRAAQAGVLVVDRAGIDALNRIDEAVTLATLPAFAAVEAGQMIGTVKIIPFAVSANAMAAARAVCGRLIEVAPHRLRRVAVISTVLPGLPEKVIAKTLRVTGARLAAMGAGIAFERRVPHDEAALAAAITEVRQAGAELIIVFGASAIADRRDAIPAAIEAAGGLVEHFGMPVDPGNLLLVARLGSVPVLGAPGCARSPKENGFDWVLRRLVAGLPVTRDDITGMGVGGLLMEIPSRPQPRESVASTGLAGAIVLAAGRGTRMPHAHKLTADLGGAPLLRRAVQAALASRARPVIVVTGHEAEKVRAALAGLDVSFVHNLAYAEGLSTSLRAGIGALPPEVDRAVVLLGDMPKVEAGLVDRLAGAINLAEGRLVAVPVSEGRRGNPVAWSRALFADLMALTGDVGARHLIAANAEAVVEVTVEGEGAFLDIDTREELEALAIHEIATNADVDAAAALEGMKAEDA
ncbi:molybdopterin-binding/glycosyltransferase family 2 protein [Ancylobacter sp. SL191]|uniref:molybdopterin-binding/glycosyltransferase family 2 protein n=1 Tax=Ancylobacter sp. SL191 TaxID=2995166 RepID=UPI00226FD5B3|nr:molybdopterin-binding/glycosyltransferase family 2 protein [Ancylobacter sp. SL191]WAC26003.1 molybdopterin-binding/glycosyltransferase family 2 protein [Ancylobacter sp. SL191]